MSVRLDIVGGLDSAWADALRSVAAGRLAIADAPQAGQGPQAWRRMLQEALSAPLPAAGRHEAAASRLPQTSGAVECWGFEDDVGQPLFAPFFAASAWQRPPYCVSLRLVAQRGSQRWLLAQACVGARDRYPDLLLQLARTAVLLLARALSDCPPEVVPVAASDLPRRAPGSATALAGGALRRQWLRNSRRWAVETWAVGIVDRPIVQVLANGELGPVTWLPWDDREGYLADPFPWPGHDERFLCERFSNRTQAGDLVTIEGRQVDEPVPVDIPERRHLSYPGAWLEGDQLLLMPESGAARRTVIYRLDDQARATPWVTVAQDCGMADPTLFRRDGLYWIAYTDTDLGLHDNLCLLFAEQLEGPWQRHAANPVKLDIRSSRPAGPVFQMGDDWFRPAQDCAADYGAALAINRIVELSPTRFREEVATILRPDPCGQYPHGLHTLSVWGERLLIDGKRWSRRPLLLADKIRNRLRRSGNS